MYKKENIFYFVWVAIFFIVLLWSSINPYDRLTWFLEAGPAMAGFFAIAITFPYFKLTKLSYILILLHCIVLMVGSHYTYAEVPLFNWIQEVFNSTRNDYDKFGHLFQGFAPAIIARELLIRTSPLKQSKWLSFIVVCICLAISAFYELAEWVFALMLGESAEYFLSMQGYIWDTQADMAYALLGAVLALVLLSRYHNKLLSKINR
ncbi:MAG: DUF2238 domain-containing protein [Waddliaceae bacterium]|jgi:putative membrane protein|nr:DUF2238 domain-containing protein [Waddliaceae bacterium]MBT3579542.1 DUF2238 domain-containing protein [Waddliaceae bacterium]MBT4444403.1 DUF2238 domain-containing protein [Waddliaceae bacterium]MBT6928655.1 DUF2238 domain-containing protein [Waddliaceae bacterium]MBT7265193.1 DUF2238 domain-containing protein [Waddliaceae bacterium]